MPNKYDSIQIATWFHSLPLLERRGRVEAMRSFFDKNTRQLLKIVRSIETTKDIPVNMLAEAKQLIANNMKMLDTLDSIEGRINKNEEENHSEIAAETSTVGQTASGE